MENLEELKIRKNYYRAKYRYIQMKIRNLQKSTEPDTSYKKTIVEGTITIEAISEEESEAEAEPEPETDNSVSSFFSSMILKADNKKIKRSESYVAYVNFCNHKQVEPLIKSHFFKQFESHVGKPKKTNVYYYMQFCFVKSDKAPTFNESIEEIIF